MSPPTVSDPLCFIVEQLKKSISQADEKCSEILPLYKARSTKTQLERLSNDLRYGGSFVGSKYSAMSRVDNHSDAEAAEGEPRLFRV